MSVTKGIMSMAAHLLHARNQLDYDAEVRNYWPEFAHAGKEHITVRQLLSHQASLPIADTAVAGDLLDFDLMVQRMEQQAPHWAPGTNPAYHAVTIGYLVGGLIERVSGRGIKEVVEQDIALPCGAKFILGCSKEQATQVTHVIENPKCEVMWDVFDSEQKRECFNMLPDDPDFFVSDEHVMTVIPSGGGVSNANGMARFYGPLANGGRFNGHHFFDEETLAKMWEVQWEGVDSIFGWPMRMALGQLRTNELCHFGNPNNIGSWGLGGYICFADPDNHISFGYSPIRRSTGAGIGEEPKRLVDALYSVLI